MAPANHAASILDNLQRLQLSVDLCDIWLECGTQCFAAHRVVLAAASKYFHAMFVGGMAEAAQRSVNLHGIADSSLSLLLRFVYTGELSMTEENCQDLLCAADMLQLTGAVNLCCDYLAHNLQLDNCIGIYDLAEARGCSSLQCASEDYISANFVDAAQQDDFSSLSASALCSLLKLDELTITDEACVLKAAITWLTADLPQRHKHTDAVLSAVRLSIVVPTRLVECLSACPDASLRLSLRNAARLASGSPVEPRHGTLLAFYVLGGFTGEPVAGGISNEVLGTVQCFSPHTQQWTLLPGSTIPRTHHAVTVLNGAIYLVGGEYESLIFADTERFDLSTSRWTTVASLTVPRSGLGVCTLGNAIYAIGGWVGAEIGRTMEVYNADLDEWAEVDALRTLRVSMGVLECNGLIYVIGGMSWLDSVLREVESYDVEKKQWRPLAPLITPRSFLAVVAHAEHIYAVGGFDEDGVEFLNSVELYSIEKDEWTFLPPMRTARAGAAAAIMHGCLYVAGGHITGGVPLASVECYDIKTGVWSDGVAMPTSCYDAAAVVTVVT